jgi:hypothetical protein
MKRGLLTAAVVLTPVLIGCGPAYHYTKMADPSVFAKPGCHAQLEPIHAEALMVGDKPEPEYAASKDGKQNASYAQDKIDSVAAFQQQLIMGHPLLFAAGGAPDNTFVIRPVWTHWEPGFYTAIVNRPGIADFTVDILVGGQPVEQIMFKGAALDFSSGGRMRGALRVSAAILTSYLNDKWLCAKFVKVN